MAPSGESVARRLGKDWFILDIKESIASNFKVLSHIWHCCPSVCSSTKKKAWCRHGAWKWSLGWFATEHAAVSKWCVQLIPYHLTCWLLFGVPQLLLQRFSLTSPWVQFEWQWNGLLATQFSCFLLLIFGRILKILLQPVGLYYIIATLLSKCHTCIYSNQIASFFNLLPPHLKTTCSKYDAIHMTDNIHRCLLYTYVHTVRDTENLTFSAEFCGCSARTDADN